MTGPGLSRLSSRLRARRWSVRGHFFVLVALFVAAAVSAAVYVERQAESDARKASAMSTSYAARIAAEQTNSYIQVVHATTQGLAANPRIADTLVNADGCTLTFAGLGGPDASHVDIVDARGTVACSSRAGAARYRYAGAWLDGAVTRPTSVGPLTDSATGKQVLLVTTPIAGRKGAVVAFVDLTSAAEHLAGLFSGGHRDEFLIVGRGGRRVISRSVAPARSSGRAVAGTPFAKGEGADRRDIDGTERLYSQAAVPAAGWTLYVGESKHAALAAVDHLTRRQLAIIAVGLAIVLAVAWLIYRNLIVPVRRLTRAVRSAREDDTEPDMSIGGGPAELRELADGFAALVSSMNAELHERERAQQLARASERNYRTLFESNPNPMWVFDTETLRFLAVNEAAEKAYGYTRDEFLSMSIDQIRPEDEVARLLETMSSLTSAGERGLNPSGLWKHRRKDGTVIDVEVSSQAHTFEGRPARVVLALDVTERIRAERAVRLSEARYRELFENATDLIATVDLDGRLTAVNEAFLRTLGYERDELLGTPLHELVPAEWHERLGSAREGKIGDEVSSTVYEHELVAKDGRRIQVEVASRLIREDGQPVGIEAICRDVTERKQLEEQLRQSQRLEAIGRLAGGIAHDFNNLLTVISGYSEELLEQGGPGTAELRQIAAAGERATVLTRQLLAFSRRQMLQPQVISLNGVVDEIMPMLTRLIGEDVDLVAALDPSLQPVRADPNQIEQVILNLAINARDAMPNGGKLTIETGNTTLDEAYVADHPDAQVGPHATLAISDNGIGMDAATVAQVFEPFFTTKPLGSGTGLGLSTVYGIVKQSGGNVWVYSEPGKGTTFKVYLPAVDEPAATAPEAPAPARSDVGAERVLIVEDEEPVRTFAANVLASRGYTVLSTASAEEAIALATREDAPVDLLLTDLVMPETGGAELAAAIRRRDPKIRVLFMSGYADEAATRHGALEIGAAYLEKPFSGAELARKVRETLGEPDTPGLRVA